MKCNVTSPRKLAKRVRREDHQQELLIAIGMDKDDIDLVVSHFYNASDTTLPNRKIPERRFYMRVLPFVDPQIATNDFNMLLDKFKGKETMLKHPHLKPKMDEFEGRVVAFNDERVEVGCHKILVFAGHGDHTGFSFTADDGSQCLMLENDFCKVLCGSHFTCIVMSWCDSYKVAKKIAPSTPRTHILSWLGETDGKSCHRFGGYFFEHLIKRTEEAADVNDVTALVRDAFQAACHYFTTNDSNSVRNLVAQDVEAILSNAIGEDIHSDFDYRLLKHESGQPTNRGEHSTRGWNPQSPVTYGTKERDVIKMLWTTRPGGTDGPLEYAPGQFLIETPSDQIPPGYKGAGAGTSTSWWLVDNKTVAHWYSQLSMTPRTKGPWYLGDVFGPNPSLWPNQQNRNPMISKLVNDRLSEDGGRELVEKAHQLLYEACLERRELGIIKEGDDFLVGPFSEHAHAWRCLVQQYNAISAILVVATFDDRLAGLL